MKNVHYKSHSGLLQPITHVFMFAVFIIFALSGCKKDETLTQTQLSAGTQSEDLTAKWGSPGIIVHKGESIQAAVDKAKNKTVIFIEPGVYKEAISVNKPGIKLIGEFSFGGDEVIIKNPGDAKNGIEVSGNGDGFVLANVTVKDFEENGETWLGSGQ